jgi:hypothetical protein
VSSNRFVLATGGNVGIGTGNPGAKLDVNGNLHVTTDMNAGTDLNVGKDIRYAGTLFMGMQTFTSTLTIPGNNRLEIVNTCPTGTRVITGGGGHRDLNSAASDIIINYSGPDPDNPNSAWRLIFTNSSGSTRTLIRYLTCARVQ